MKIPKPGERVPRACEFITQSNRLLDVGCGDGILEKFTRRKVKNYYGIDLDKYALKIAQKHGYKTCIVDLDKQKFPYTKNFFDIVVCLDVIEHVRDPDLLVKEMFRVLRPTGKLILATPNIRFSDHLITLIVKGRFPKTSDDRSLYDGGHLHFFTFKDIEHLLAKEKFKDIKNLGIINKKSRGWKGKIFQTILGERLMLEFRTPGILVIATK